MGDSSEKMVSLEYVLPGIKTEKTCCESLDTNLINNLVESSAEITSELLLGDFFKKSDECILFENDENDETDDEIIYELHAKMNMSSYHYHTFPKRHYLWWLFHSGLMPNWQLILLASCPNSGFGYGRMTYFANINGVKNNQTIFVNADIVYRQYVWHINESRLFEDELILSNITTWEYDLILKIKSNNSQCVTFLVRFKEFIRRFEKLTLLRIKKGQIETQFVQQIINHVLEPVNDVIEIRWK